MLRFMSGSVFDHFCEGWMYLGAGTGVGLSLSGEGGSEDRGGEVGTAWLLCSLTGGAATGGSSAHPI